MIRWPLRSMVTVQLRVWAFAAAAIPDRSMAREVNFGRLMDSLCQSWRVTPAPLIAIIQHQDECPPARLSGWLTEAGAELTIVRVDLGARLPQPGVKPGASVPNRFYMYGVIGRLAMLAGSYELEATDPDAERYD